MDQIPLQLEREGIKEREDRERGGGGDYSREVIISNISIKGGDYSREVINSNISIKGGAIIRGTAIIRRKALVTRHNKLQTITNLAVIACKLERLTISCGRKNKRLLAV